MPTRLVLALAAATAVFLGAAPHGGHGMAEPPAPDAPLAVSKDRPFQELMDASMHRMHAGMEGAPRSGDPDRDFVTQMIPHHQGAVDMARILLVHGADPELRQLAKGIIAEQQNEIQLMRAWLEKHPPRATAPTTKESP
jgi:DUF305 family protein family protein